MKALKFTGAQKAFILKQGEEGAPVAEICRRGGDQPGDLFQLEEEVCRLVADGDDTAEAT